MYALTGQPGGKQKVETHYYLHHLRYEPEALTKQAACPKSLTHRDQAGSRILQPAPGDTPNFCMYSLLSKVATEVIRDVAAPIATPLRYLPLSFLLNRVPPVC